MALLHLDALPYAPTLAMTWPKCFICAGSEGLTGSWPGPGLVIYSTPPWSKVPSFPAPTGAGNGETKWVVPEKFFDQLSEVLQTVRSLPGEEAMYGQFKSLLNAAANDPQIKATLTETAVTAENELINHLA
jgi:hypothetical protein